MTMLKKVLLWAVGGVVAVAGGLLGWVLLTWDRVHDDVPIPALEASGDPAVIERGRYLVRGPSHCSVCHMNNLAEVMRSEAGEELPLRGGLEFPIDPLAVFYTANLTPDPDTGIGRYTDGQLFRMLRHNVKPDGRASLAPLMPFANMADDDLVAIVSYLRTGEPVRTEVPAARWTLMGKAISALVRPAAFQPVLGHSPPALAPPQEATVERGGYLANSVANCVGCHSPIDLATGDMTGPAFSGNGLGEPSMIDPNVMLRMPNLTPDPGGVLARFPSEDVWIRRFRAGRVVQASIMPWGPYSNMSDEDLRAIYRYLNSLDPVANDVGPTVERISR
ncbi:MAG: cytochrome C [Acidobacteria bacterium]|nr:cytochrome C [Acidobacteriota bacterium]